MKGQFIVLEGVDGAGTTTHTKKLVDELRRRGIAVKATREPSDGPIGVLLRQFLSGRLIVPNQQTPSWTTMALLFAADRMDHIQSEIIPALAKGIHVICDRYDYSSIAYQSLSAGNDSNALPWIVSLNRFAPRPDLTLILDAPPSVSAQRRKSRIGEEELFDDDDFQARLQSVYARLPTVYASDRIRSINADQAVDSVARDIMSEICALGLVF